MHAAAPMFFFSQQNLEGDAGPAKDEPLLSDRH